MQSYTKLKQQLIFILITGYIIYRVRSQLKYRLQAEIEVIAINRSPLQCQSESTFDYCGYALSIIQNGKNICSFKMDGLGYSFKNWKARYSQLLNNTALFNHDSQLFLIIHGDTLCAVVLTTQFYDVMLFHSAIRGRDCCSQQ